MVWPAVIGAVVGVLGQVSASASSRSAAKDAKKAGWKSAAFIMKETAEELRRKGISDKMVEGEGRATVAAAGLRVGDSTSAYLNFLQGERNRENAWTLRAGQLRAEAAVAGASTTAKGLKAESTLYALKGVQSAFNAYDRELTGAQAPGGEGL